MVFQEQGGRDPGKRGDALVLQAGDTKLESTCLRSQLWLITVETDLESALSILKCAHVSLLTVLM